MLAGIDDAAVDRGSRRQRDDNVARVRIGDGGIADRQSRFDRHHAHPPGFALRAQAKAPAGNGDRDRRRRGGFCVHRFRSGDEIRHHRSWNAVALRIAYDAFDRRPPRRHELDADIALFRVRVTGDVVNAVAGIRQTVGTARYGEEECAVPAADGFVTVSRLRLRHDADARERMFLRIAEHTGDLCGRRQLQGLPPLHYFMHGDAARHRRTQIAGPRGDVLEAKRPVGCGRRYAPRQQFHACTRYRFSLCVDDAPLHGLPRLEREVAVGGEGPRRRVIAMPHAEHAGPQPWIRQAVPPVRIRRDRHRRSVVTDAGHLRPLYRLSLRRHSSFDHRCRTENDWIDRLVERRRGGSRCIPIGGHANGDETIALAIVAQIEDVAPIGVGSRSSQRRCIILHRHRPFKRRGRRRLQGHDMRSCHRRARGRHHRPSKRRGNRRCQSESGHDPSEHDAFHDGSRIAPPHPSAL